MGAEFTSFDKEKQTIEVNYKKTFDTDRIHKVEITKIHWIRLLIFNEFFFWDPW